MRITVALWTAVVATAPITLWQILAFFLPALKPRERKWFLPTFIAALTLFIIGTVFCYCVILNPAFQWLTDQASGFATILPEAGQWVDIIIKFELGFGIGFEMPLVVFYLVMFGVVPYKKLRASWRAVYIGLLVFSAAVTPDAFSRNHGPYVCCDGGSVRDQLACRACRPQPSHQAQGGSGKG